MKRLSWAAVLGAAVLFAGTSLSYINGRATSNAGSTGGITGQTVAGKKAAATGCVAPTPTYIPGGVCGETPAVGYTGKASGGCNDGTAGMCQNCVPVSAWAGCERTLVSAKAVTLTGNATIAISQVHTSATEAIFGPLCGYAGQEIHFTMTEAGNGTAEIYIQWSDLGWINTHAVYTCGEM